MPTPQLDKEVDRLVHKYPWHDSGELFRSELIYLVNQAYNLGVISTIERVEGIIGEDDEEGDGWDVFFSEELSCCPGDDIAFARNDVRKQQRQALSTLKQELLAENGYKIVKE